jgi:predicted AAA+ superfamily ATPase
MPEAVLEYIESTNFEKIRNIQNNIITGYEQDFSKYASPSTAQRIKQLWDSIPAQLAKENKKFIYGAVKKGARAKDFEIALSWLFNSGIVYKVHRIKKPGLPLKAYEDFSAFKLFLMDTGLLGAMSNLSAKAIIDGNRIFEEFKGALTEQYVLQQLMVRYRSGVYYWSSERSSGEIDFIVQDDDVVIPLEVKAEENLKAKSLKAFAQKYPETKAVRVSMSDYRIEKVIVNLPLFALEAPKWF